MLCLDSDSHSSKLLIIAICKLMVNHVDHITDYFSSTIQALPSNFALLFYFKMIVAN